MWQLRIICIVLSAIYAQEITAKTLSTLITEKIEGKNVTIAGGHNIDIKEAPFQVSIEHLTVWNETFIHVCGGSIIANDIILTAAVCARGPPDDYRVRAGSTLRGSGGFLVPVEKVAYHPDFHLKYGDYNVGLMKLKTPLNFSDTVKAIDMMADGENINDGAMFTVTGWGDTKANQSSLSMILQQVTVHQVNEEVCREDFKDGPPITSRMICAGEPGGGKDACDGDAGGPLVYNGKQAGIVSWTGTCGEPQYPGVYTKISALRKWIDDSIKNITAHHDSVN